MEVAKVARVSRLGSIILFQFWGDLGRNLLDMLLGAHSGWEDENSLGDRSV